MLICHNVLPRMMRRYCKHVMCRTCMHCHATMAQCSPISTCHLSVSVWLCHASVVVGYVPLSASSSLIYHFWFLKHHHSAATHHHHRRCCRSCRTHEICMHAERIIIIFYIFYFIFCSLYLVLFSIVLYHEWPHRQGGCLACCGCTFESRWGCTFLYYARGAQGVLPMRLGGATSELDLPPMTPLSVAGCGWLQLGVPYWAAAVHYCK